MEIDHDLRGNDSTDKPNAGDHFTLETDLIDVRSEESISSQVLAKGGKNHLLVLLRHFA